MDGANLVGSIHFGDAAQTRYSTALPLLDWRLGFHKRLVFSHIASTSNFFTGLSIVNDENEEVPVRIEVFDAHGQILASAEFPVWYRTRLSRLLTEYFPELKARPLEGGYIVLSSPKPFGAFALFGSWDLSVLSAVPGQVPE